MTEPKRMDFAALSDPERGELETVDVTDVFNPCGGRYSFGSKGKQYLAPCPTRAQAPYTIKGKALYKYAQCIACQDAEREAKARHAATVIP